MTAFPSLSLPFGLVRILRVNVVVKYRNDLVCERHWVNKQVQHIYEIPFAALTDANRLTLEAFFATCRGKYLGDIAFVDPWDGLTYTCRLDNDELVMQGGNPIYSGAIRLVEVASFKAVKAAVTTFPITVPFQLPYSKGNKYATVITATPSDAERRYEDLADASGIQYWGVGGDNLTNAQATDLLACWEGNGGPWGEFAFTEPADSGVYNAHFVESQLNHVLVCIRSDTEKLHSIKTFVEELKES
jgi:hypothetical protein